MSQSILNVSVYPCRLSVYPCRHLGLFAIRTPYILELVGSIALS